MKAKKHVCFAAINCEIYLINIFNVLRTGLTVLNFLQAHRALPFALWASRLVLFAMWIRFAPSVCKSACVDKADFTLSSALLVWLNFVSSTRGAVGRAKPRRAKKA